jgi:hypothetical protein
MKEVATTWQLHILSIKNLDLTTQPHPHLYHIQWPNNSGKLKVTQTTWVHFSIGTYVDFVDCDVVPIQA